jgi:peptidoglycan/LPS O-acetylase OafA/YrhL
LLILLLLGAFGVEFEVHSLTPVVDGVLHAVFLQNIVPEATWSVNGVFWTMAIEVQFYILLPLLAVSMWAIACRFGVLVASSALVTTLASIAVVSAKLISLPRLAAFPLAAFFFGEASTGRSLIVFGCGIVCSLAYVYLTHVRTLGATAQMRLRIIATSVAMGSILFGAAIAFVPALHGLPFKTVLFGWIYAGVLFGILLGVPALRWVVESPPLRFLGLISYSFYIWHNVVLDLLSSWFPSLGSLDRPEVVIVRLAMGLIVSLVVAYVSYQLTERPFIRARKTSHDRCMDADLRLR